MKYLNENYRKCLLENEEYKGVIDKIKNEVDEFYSEFHDDPTNNSEWGHNYFCDYDGGRLIFDIHKPHDHICSVCGKNYKGELYDGVWTYFYRNQAVLTMWKAAGVYAFNKDEHYLSILKDLMSFYAKHYKEFKIHNKEREVFDSYDHMKWGCGRILPQGLNESIIAIRMIQALEIVKEDIDKEFKDFVYENLFKEIYHLLRPQVNAIHNIRCWNISAIGLIGLYFNDKEMIDFVFNGEFNIYRQIREGVTSDGFWYEGSIHYNFFTLEGISPLLLFGEIYNHPFIKEAKDKVEMMFISAYNYSFDNQYLPNPNDGWPSINLKTYSYIYHVASHVFGEDSDVGNILKNIEANPNPRTPLPLSKPYYIDNKFAYERLLLNTDYKYNDYIPVKQSTKNFPNSNYAMLRNDYLNVFVKYGLNGPSHAHPDLINVEVMYKNDRISRDLSNAGYQSKMCKEWHRMSLAHNTIIRNGENIPSTTKGDTISYNPCHIVCKHEDVYPGVCYTRDVEIKENILWDSYLVQAKEEANFDYVFHLEANINVVIPDNAKRVENNMGFDNNGYQHILEAYRVNTQNELTINASLDNKEIKLCLMDLNGKEVYILKTMDNPVNKTRTTMLVRSFGKLIDYKMRLEIKE